MYKRKLRLFLASMISFMSIYKAQASYTEIPLADEGTSSSDAAARARPLFQAAALAQESDKIVDPLHGFGTAEGKGGSFIYIDSTQSNQNERKIGFKVFYIDSSISSEDLSCFYKRTIQTKDNKEVNILYYPPHFGEIADEHIEEMYASEEAYGWDLRHKINDWVQVAIEGRREEAIKAIEKEFPGISPILMKEEISEVQEMTPEDLAEHLCHGRTLFYTGAGLSSSIIPTLEDFWRSLGFEKEIPMKSRSAEECLDWIIEYQSILDKEKDVIRSLIRNPETVITKTEAFAQRLFCRYPATPAHSALKDLVVNLKAPLVTTNDDFLHQESGIVPLKNLELEKVSPQEWQSFRQIVVIGHSTIWEPLLDLYRQHNPSGKIIFMNLEQPKDFPSSLLSKDSYVVLGDVQETLPKIWDAFKLLTPTESPAA